MEQIIKEDNIPSVAFIGAVMSEKDGDAGKEVPSTSRKTPLLGARGVGFI